MAGNTFPWRFFLIGGCCLLTAAVVFLLADLTGRREEPVIQAEEATQGAIRNSPAAAPPQSSSLPGQTLTSVGTAVCASCHEKQHESYLLTAHSRAMGLVDPDAEPPDGGFYHEPSKRYYSIYRHEGRLWHTESLKPVDSGTTSVGSTESADELREPLKYLVGSGRHSRTYLVEMDGFLMESPVTWYTSTRNWSMSPGYNHAHHAGFERAADMGCLICHVGQAEPIDGALNRLLISETAIGCERCHGPGSAHVAKWTSHPTASRGTIPAPDESIGHPGRMSRDLQEAICSQCHLRGDATVIQRGKSATDFRPGTPLTETRIDYHLGSDSGGMKVVGHVDQMHASRCYQQSSTMTCTTCHDSHADMLPDPASGFYRTKCMECHSRESCGLSLSEREQQAPSDNCVRCHMPQVSTDIPHIAFTHHRIGVHIETKADPPSETAPGRLIPFGDIADLSDTQQERCLGLAYAELADRQAGTVAAGDYRNRAAELLEGVVKSGEADGDVFAALARFAWEEEKPTLAMDYAQQALANRDLSVKARVNSLLIAGDCYLQAQQSARAIAPLEELVALRRFSQDWLLLGISRFQSGQKEAGIAAVRQATLIQPFRDDLRSMLEEMQRAAGK